MSNEGKSKLETEYLKIKKAFAQLNKLKGDEYYAKFELLKLDFKEFLHAFGPDKPVMFIDLKRQNFIDLCCMVSTLRPVEPWQFLVKVSVCNEARQ